MISSTWHFNLNVIRTFSVLLSLALLSCEKPVEKVDYYARVNNSYLTREEYASLVDTSTTTQARKNEIISRWIQSELLYQQAEKEGLLQKEEYQIILRRSARELAGALLLEKLISAENIKANKDEVKDYYEKNLNEFRLPSEGFILNLAEFIDEEKAIRFRKSAIESGWEKAISPFLSEKSVINYKSNHLFMDFELNPAPIARLVNQLYPQEISIVISARPGYYSVVKMISRLPGDSVPEIDYVYRDAEQRVIAIKRQALVNSYIKNLYSKSKIEIRNQD